MSLADAKISLYDADDQSYAPREKTSTTVSPGGTEQVELGFATADASPGTFEVRIENLPVKV